MYLITKAKLNFLLTIIAAYALTAVVHSKAQAEPEKAEKASGRLVFETSVTRDDLQGLNSVELSADGRFAYATPWPIGAVVVFERDARKGALTHVQTLRNPGLLAGDTGITFSPSTNLAVAACFNAKTAVLMRCDPKTGKLTILNSARDGEKNVTGLDFAIDAIFSPDGKHVYVLNGGRGGIAIFKMRENKLEWLESFTGEDNCLANSRGAAFDPKGNTLYVTSAGANTLTVLMRDPQSGLLKVKQVIHDEEDGVEGLGGAFGVVCTGDGQFIYTTSGRFSGDSAVSVFRRNDQGKLELVHELIAPRDNLPFFDGGNRLTLSPDEKNLYVAATRSGSVACFARDSKSGRIKHMETLTQDEDSKGIVAGAAGIAISPDGKYVYVAAEERATISIFRRE